MSQPAFDELVPFVPAYDLVEAGSKLLGHSELAAIAVALLELLPPAGSTESSAWQVQSRLAGISRRL